MCIVYPAIPPCISHHRILVLIGKSLALAWYLPLCSIPISIYLYHLLHLAILQQFRCPSAVSRCIPLFPVVHPIPIHTLYLAVSLYPAVYAVSACNNVTFMWPVACIPLYLAVSHRLEHSKTGYDTVSKNTLRLRQGRADIDDIERIKQQNTSI